MSDSDSLSDSDRADSRHKRPRSPQRHHKIIRRAVESEVSNNTLYVGVCAYFKTLSPSFKRLLNDQGDNKVKALILACYEDHPTMCDYKSIVSSPVIKDVMLLLEECFVDVNENSKIVDGLVALDCLYPDL